MAEYDSIAMQIIQGTLPKEPYAWYPAYCYFVAGVYRIFGHSPVAAMVVQSLIGCITYWLVYLISKGLFNKWVGIIAVLLCSVYGRFIMYEAVLLSPAIDALFITLAVFIGIKAVEQKKKTYFLVLGIVLGLSTLSRPNILLVAPFFLIYILIMVKGIKQSVLANLLVVAGIVMMIAPVTARNFVYSGGKFIPIVTGGSLELWVGNNPDSDGTFFVPPLTKEIEQRWEKLGKKDPYLADTIEFITKTPDKYCLLLLKKLAIFWNSGEIYDNNIMFDRVRDKSPILGLPLILPFGLIAPLALTGIILSIWVYSRRLLFLYLVLFGYTGSIILFFVQSRIRLPIVPCLMIFAAFAIYWFYKNLRWHKNKTAVLFVVIFAFLYGVVNPHLYLGWLHPIIKPHGFCIEKRYGTVIRDDSSQWHGNKAVILNSEEDVLKKELIIDFKPSARKGFGVGLNTFYASSDKGYLLIEINGKKVTMLNLSPLNTNGFYRTVRLGIKPEYFKKGVNTIHFRAIEGASIQIPIDNYYKFGRSKFSRDNGTNWKVQKGEYMIYLDMKKGEY